MTTRPSPLLSPDGAARRANILDRAQRALATRRRRRTMFRVSSLALVPAACVVAAAMVVRSPNGAGTPDAGNAFPSAATAPGAAAPSLVQFVRANQGALARVRISTRPLPASARIADDELLDLLLESGRDGGIIRIGSQVILASDLVEDTPDADPLHGPG
jgi:hypothetical protein